MRLNWNNIQILRLRVSVVCLLFFGAACEDLGFQGGIIPTNFSGLKQLEAVSPEAFQMTWDPYPGATQYRVYMPDMNEPVARPGFTTLITRPPGGISGAGGEYSFSVTAVDPSTGREEGERGNYLKAKLLPRFNFKNEGTVVALDMVPPTRHAIKVSWNAYPKVNYQVYVGERMPTGEVNYNLGSSSGSVTGEGSVEIENLKEGREYCAFAIATYTDSTRDGPNGQALTGTLSSLMGTAGSFNTSVIGTSQKCVRTKSDPAFTSLVEQSKVYTAKATLSNKPSFYADVQGDTTPDGVGTTRVVIYKIDGESGVGVYLGALNGTGRIDSAESLPPGRYTFRAIFEKLGGNSTAQKDKGIIVGPTHLEPVEPVANPTDRPWVYVRGLGASQSDEAYYPEKQQGGLGSQKIGSSVAMGDFNCDGRFDIAVGVPEYVATLPAPDNRPANLGKVMIYYNTATVAAATAPGVRSQEIIFDLSDKSTAFAGGRDLRLGTKLHVGNFNSDNQATHNPPGYPDATLQTAFKCDDLVIGSGYGPSFVLYGSRDTSGANGGLVYSGPKVYMDNIQSCDPSKNTCIPTIYHYRTPAISLSSSYTSGDFNGDGFEDLAIGSGANAGIWVLRGSEFGLIPPRARRFGSDPTVYAQLNDAFDTDEGPGGKMNFPYVHSNTNQFYPIGYAPTQSGWAANSFGNSVAAIRNAFYDSDNKRIKSILLVGSPATQNTGAGGTNNSSGRVFACVLRSLTGTRPAPLPGTFSNAFANDSMENQAWDCNHAINPPVRSGVAPNGNITAASGFGSAMATLDNPLRYMLNGFQESSCPAIAGGVVAPSNYGNCSDTSTHLGLPGGVAIAAPGSNQVFVYYGVAVAGGMGDRLTQGNARNGYIEKFFDRLWQPNTLNTLHNPAPSLPYTKALALDTKTSDPCTSADAPTEECLIQVITQPSSQSGDFGTVVANLKGNIIPNDSDRPQDSILGVAAPNRSVVVGGLSYTSVGTVYLYRQSSRFSTDPITLGSAPIANQRKRYSTGFSMTQVSPIDYSGPPNNFIRFGLGGIASGPIEAPLAGTAYSSNSDVVIGAPGHVKIADASGQTIPPVYDNGAFMTYFSHGGTYNKFRIGQTQTSGWNLSETVLDSSGNVSGQESNLRFHQAVSVGDILDLDGYSDVAVRIARGSSRNIVRLYRGSACSDWRSPSCRVTLKRNSSDFVTLTVSSDDTAGFRVIPTGLVSGSLGSLFIVGSNSSYMYFAGAGGINQGVPSEVSNPGSPRKFSNPANGNYLRFGNSSFYNEETTNLTSTIDPSRSFAVGDFNGDGKMDLAFGQTVNSLEDSGIADNRNAPADPCPGNRCLSSWAGQASADRVGRGRVYVIYGGGPNGFYPQADANFGYPLQAEYAGQDFSNYGFTGFSSTVVSNNKLPLPCTSQGLCPRIQAIAEKDTTTFGSVVSSIPFGTCGGKPVSALAVRAGYAGESKLFLYKPACLLQEGNLSGLGGFNMGGTYHTNTIEIASNSIGLNAATSTGFAVSFAGFSKLSEKPANDSPLIGHLAIADELNRKVFILPLVTSEGGKVLLNDNKLYPQVPGSAGPSQLAAGSFSSMGGGGADYSNSSFISGHVTGADSGFGSGLANLGDLNGDGLEDLGINLFRMNRKETSRSYSYQGGVLVVFGGITGAQTHQTDGNVAMQLEPKADAECYMRQELINSQPKRVTRCNPTLLFAPQPQNSVRLGQYEYISLTRFSTLQTGMKNEATGVCQAGSSNECLGSFILGVPGRDSAESSTPSKPILQGGAFYVVP